MRAETEAAWMKKQQETGSQESGKETQQRPREMDRESTTASMQVRRPTARVETEALAAGQRDSKLAESPKPAHQHLSPETRHS